MLTRKIGRNFKDGLRLKPYKIQSLQYISKVSKLWLEGTGNERGNPSRAVNYESAVKVDGHPKNLKYECPPFISCRSALRFLQFRWLPEQIKVWTSKYRSSVDVR